jgi:hypothetical protein
MLGGVVVVVGHLKTPRTKKVLVLRLGAFPVNTPCRYNLGRHVAQARVFAEYVIQRR